jgi:2-polyprenyl-3-methyl-5-hydroxy-6-metoxy-1,4-benzoquinol methylase
MTVDEEFLKPFRAMVKYPWLPGELKERRLEREVMDDPALDDEAHHHALEGIHWINVVSGFRAGVWRLIRRELDAADGQPLSLVDLACADGRLLRWLHGRAGDRLQLSGIDLSETAITRAREKSPETITYYTGDILEEGTYEQLPRIDILTGCLFAHHLSEQNLLKLFQLAQKLQPRRFILNDITRSWVSWWSIFVTARILTRSPVVHIDSGLSVSAAFTIEEIRQLAEEAGLKGVRVSSQFPFRLMLSWSPHE